MTGRNEATPGKIFRQGMHKTNQKIAIRIYKAKGNTRARQKIKAHLEWVYKGSGKNANISRPNSQDCD